MSCGSLANRLASLRARIAAQRPVPDDLALSVADLHFLDMLFVELEMQRGGVAPPPPRPAVLVTTQAEESAA